MINHIYIYASHLLRGAGIWIPTFARRKSPSFVGKYSIHGAHGMYKYIYIYMCVCVCVYVYIFHHQYSWHKYTYTLRYIKIYLYLSIYLYIYIYIYLYLYMEHLGKWCPVPTEKVPTKISSANNRMAALALRSSPQPRGAKIVRKRVVVVADWTKHRRKMAIERSWVFPRKNVIWIDLVDLSIIMLVEIVSFP